MDLQSPGWTAPRHLRRLRADPATAGVPVIAVTAFAMKQDRERTRPRLRRIHRETGQRAELPEQVRGSLAGAGWGS